MEQDQRERETRREAGKLRAARAQGLLDPLLDYLNRQIGLTNSPEMPMGPEWAFQRAFADGQTQQTMKILDWIEGRTSISPDEAENTEDRHE